MAMYTINTVPLIDRLSNENTQQTWYADDASAAGEIYVLRHWWDNLVQIGPDYRYHPNAPKTWLIVKEEIFPLAQTTFEGTGVSITMEGKRHLGAAIGTEAFKEVYVREKVAKWVLEVDSLMTIALTQPHATYVAFTHGLAAKWNYLSRTISGIADLFQPLEDIVNNSFRPSQKHFQ